MIMSSVYKLVFALLFFLISLAGCSHYVDAQTTTSTNAALTTTQPAASADIIAGQLDVSRIRIDFYSINITGTAGLPDGTVLHSRLFEGETALAWWPTGTDIIVRDSQWLDWVALEAAGQTKNILAGPIYRYEIWQQDDPANTAGLFFDIVGPPPAEPWWRNGIFWLMIGIGIGILAVIAVIIFLMRAKHRESNTLNTRP
jgi:hypothetical protein